MITAAAHRTPAPTTGSSIVAPPLHDDARSKAATDLVGGATGTITTETLPNGVKLIIAERPGAAATKVQLGIGAGSMQDPVGKLGAAHLLEHLAFEGSPSMSGAKQQAARSDLGGYWNAYTDQDSVVYFGVVPGAQAERGAELLVDMFRHPNLAKDALEQERAAVQNEIRFRTPVGVPTWEAFNELVYGDDPRTNNIIGTPQSVDAITAKDLKSYHSSYFTGRNTVALVEGDRRNLPLDTLREQLGKLPAGARVDNAVETATIERGRAIKQIPGVEGAVELAVALPFSKEAFESIDPIRRSLVKESLADVLHTRMRRHHDLTYGVRAGFSIDDTADGAMLVIETTVAPEAVRAATKDIFSIVQDARDGFGAKALQGHKRSLASFLRQRDVNLETIRPKVSNVAEQAFQSALTTGKVSVGSLEPVAPKSARTQKAALTKEISKLNAIAGAQFAKAAAQLISLDDAKVLVVGDGDVADVRAGMRDAGIDTKGVKTLA